MGKLPKGVHSAAFILGAGAQLSFFLTFFNVDYFQHFFSADASEFYLNMALSLSSLMGVAVAVKQKYIKSYQFTLVAGYAFSGFMCLCMPIATALPSYVDSVSRQSAFILVIAIKFLLGFAQSLPGGSLFAMLSQEFSVEAVQAAQAGTPWGGLFVYVLHVILKITFLGTECVSSKNNSSNNNGTSAGLSGNNDAKWALVGYIQFSIAAVILFACCWLVPWLQREGKSAGNPLSEILTQSNKDMEEATKDKKSGNEASGLKAIPSKVWGIAVHLVIFLTMTMSFYPGAFSVIHGAKDGWFIVIVFGCFGLSDALGQTLPKYLRWYTPSNYWIGFIIQAAIAVPIVFIFAFGEKSTGVLHSNWVVYLLALLWGLNCGYVCCSGMVMGVEMAPKNMRPTVSTFLLLSLQLGLFIGSLVGVLLMNVALKHFNSVLLEYNLCSIW